MSDEAEQDQDELPASVLTPSQRQYLRGERNVTDSAERAIRSRIRNRLQASVFDLQLIVDSFSLEDIDRGLSEPDWYDFEPGSTPPVTNCMPALPALLYLYHRRDEQEADRADGWRTQNDVEHGIEMALTRMGVGYDQLEVDINIVRADDLESLAEGDLAERSRKQLRQMLFADIIDEVEFSQAIAARQERLEEDGTGVRDLSLFESEDEGEPEERN